MPKKRTRVIGGDSIIEEDEYTVIGVTIPKINNHFKAWEINVLSNYRAAIKTSQANK
jgi:hypothetical protein